MFCCSKILNEFLHEVNKVVLFEPPSGCLGDPAPLASWGKSANELVYCGLGGCLRTRLRGCSIGDRSDAVHVRVVILRNCRSSWTTLEVHNGTKSIVVLKDECIPDTNRLSDILSVVERNDIPLAVVEFCPPSQTRTPAPTPIAVVNNHGWKTVKLHSRPFTVHHDKRERLSTSDSCHSTQCSAAQCSHDQHAAEQREDGLNCLSTDLNSCDTENTAAAADELRSGFGLSGRLDLGSRTVQFSSGVNVTQCVLALLSWQTTCRAVD